MPSTSRVQNDAQKKRTMKSLGAAVPLPPPPQPDEGLAAIVLDEGSEEKQYFHVYVLIMVIIYLSFSTFKNDEVYHFLLRPDASKRYQIFPALPGEKLPKFENVLTMVKHYIANQS